MTHQLPRLEPLAPIFDQMREIAKHELPASQTGLIKLYADGTFRAGIWHKTNNGRKTIRYERETSEIIWEHTRGYHKETTELTGGETIYAPAYDSQSVRTIAFVDPPHL